MGLAIHEKLEKTGTGNELFHDCRELLEQLGAYHDLAVTASRAHPGERIPETVSKHTASTLPPRDGSPEGSYRHPCLAAHFTTYLSSG